MNDRRGSWRRWAAHGRQRGGERHLTEVLATFICKEAAFLTLLRDVPCTDGINLRSCSRSVVLRSVD